MTRTRRALVGLSVLAVSATAAGGVVAATRSSDEAALQPTRDAAPTARIERRVDAPAARR